MGEKLRHFPRSLRSEIKADSGYHCEFPDCDVGDPNRLTADHTISRYIARKFLKKRVDELSSKENGQALCDVHQHGKAKVEQGLINELHQGIPPKPEVVFERVIEVLVEFQPNIRIPWRAA